MLAVGSFLIYVANLRLSVAVKPLLSRVGFCSVIGKERVKSLNATMTHITAWRFVILTLCKRKKQPNHFGCFFFYVDEFKSCPLWCQFPLFW